MKTGQDFTDGTFYALLNFARDRIAGNGEAGPARAERVARFYVKLCKGAYKARGVEGLREGKLPAAATRSGCLERVKVNKQTGLSYFRLLEQFGLIGSEANGEVLITLPEAFKPEFASVDFSGYRAKVAAAPAKVAESESERQYRHDIEEAERLGLIEKSEPAAQQTAGATQAERDHANYLAAVALLREGRAPAELIAKLAPKVGQEKAVAIVQRAEVDVMIGMNGGSR